MKIDYEKHLRTIISHCHIGRNMEVMVTAKQ